MQIFRYKKSTKCHHLNKLGNAWVPNAAYQVSRSSAFQSREKDFQRVFTIYGHGGHLGHVTNIPCTNFDFPIQ